MAGGKQDTDGSIIGLLETKFYNISVDNSGTTKEILTKIETYDLNTNGYLLKSYIDILGDKSIDSTVRYDVDANGRATKAYFDNDGDTIIDRVEAYTLDANGYITRTEVDNGNNNSIDVVRTYVHDALGRVLVENIDEKDDKIIDTRYVKSYDNYGNQDTNITYSYNPQTKVLEQTTSWEKTFDSKGQTLTMTYPDHTIVFTYDNYGRILSDVVEAFNRNWVYTYNNDNTVASRTDYDKTGEVLSKTVNTDYYAHSRLSKESETYDADNKLVSTQYFERSDSGTIMNTLIDLANNSTGWDTYTFGDSNRIISLNNSQDFTTWSEEKLAELGNSLSLIRMAHGAVSELTLNAEVVAKISNGGLVVEGAADNKVDVLNLSGFTKAQSSSMGGYDLYTASVAGEDLNVYVQTNIDTHIIG